jgi:hypothetical protein
MSRYISAVSMFRIGNTTLRFTLINRKWTKQAPPNCSYLYQNTRLHIPENASLCIQHHKNCKSRLNLFFFLRCDKDLVRKALGALLWFCPRLALNEPEVIGLLVCFAIIVQYCDRDRQSHISVYAYIPPKTSCFGNVSNKSVFEITHDNSRLFVANLMTHINVIGQ